MSAVLQVKPQDRQIYESRIRDFLPQRFIDIHTHVWLEKLKKGSPLPERVVSWPSRVAQENPIEDHLECYRLLFPGKEVTPCIFAGLIEAQNADAQNGYIADCARKYGQRALWPVSFSRTGPRLPSPSREKAVKCTDCPSPSGT